MSDDLKWCFRCGWVYESYWDYLSHGAYACMKVWRARAEARESELEEVRDGLRIIMSLSKPGTFIHEKAREIYLVKKSG